MLDLFPLFVSYIQRSPCTLIFLGFPFVGVYDAFSFSLAQWGSRD